MNRVNLHPEAEEELRQSEAFYKERGGHKLAADFLARVRASLKLIARDPVRFRPLMIPAILEKLVYSIPVIVLVLQKRTNPADLLFSFIDLAFGILFAIAYLRTPDSLH